MDELAKRGVALIRATYATFDSYDHVDSDSGVISFPRSIADNICPCCGGRFVALSHQPRPDMVLGMSICTSCGWWHLHRDLLNIPLHTDLSLTSARWWELHHAVMAKIDLNVSDLPIETLQAHFARHWAHKTDLSAQQAEDIVASVLREYYGGDVERLTANANAADGGIDLIILSNGGVLRRAVQVKRRLTRDVESVQEVRNFVGAMLLEGESHGTFVTTASRFTKPALRIPENKNVERARMEIELIDGERLLELLEYSERQRAPELPETLGFDQIWTASDGSTLRGDELLIGDLRRLQRLMP